MPSPFDTAYRNYRAFQSREQARRALRERRTRIRVYGALVLTGLALALLLSTETGRTWAKSLFYPVGEGRVLAKESHAERRWFTHESECTWRNNNGSCLSWRSYQQEWIMPLDYRLITEVGDGDETPIKKFRVWVDKPVYDQIRAQAQVDFEDIDARYSRRKYSGRRVY